MDVQQYFNPVDFSVFSEKNLDNWKYTLGLSIEKTTLKLTEKTLGKVDAVLFGVPCFDGVWEEGKNSSTKKIREELYNLAGFNHKLNIADLGDLKISSGSKGTQLAIRDLVEYFSELNIVTIILGGSSDLSVGICEAFKSEKYFTLSSIDAFLDVKRGKGTIDSTNYLSRIFQKQSNLFQFNLLGYQRHLVSTDLFSKTNGFGEHLSLGELNENLKCAEPVLRNTNVLIFDMNSIKYAEIAGSSFTNPNGLQSNEICQLAKYGGFSNKIKVFGLFETEFKKDSFGITFKLAAQILWYFLEGLTNRTVVLEYLTNKILIYKVEVDELEKPLKFFFSKETSRWWVEIQSIRDEKIIVACSEKEYQQASKNEIPDLWLNYVQKIDYFEK